MSRTPLILAAVGALAVGGGLFYASQKPAQTPPESAQSSGAPRAGVQSAPAGGALSAPTSEDPKATTASGEERKTADGVKLEGVVGVQGKLLPMREISEVEKLAVRDLVKMHVATPENGVTNDGSQPPAGYDADSLMIKYGSMDVAQLQEAHASVRAILDWQSNGPFTDKTAELLPQEIRRGMEIELEWLEQTILYP